MTSPTPYFLRALILQAIMPCKKLIVRPRETKFDFRFNAGSDGSSYTTQYEINNMVHGHHIIYISVVVSNRRATLPGEGAQ